MMFIVNHRIGVIASRKRIACDYILWWAGIVSLISLSLNLFLINLFFKIINYIHDNNVKDPKAPDKKDANDEKH